MRTTVFSTPLLTPVLRGLALLILVLIGWSTRGEPLAHQRCILIGAPHTSNWDFVIAIGIRKFLREEINFVISLQGFPRENIFRRVIWRKIVLYVIELFQSI